MPNKRFTPTDDRLWWQATTIYQVYPRSYLDSNGDGIGDIAGILAKLNYIRDLGFETIWFSPFFASPQRDFGYDISDYLSIAPEYGTLDMVDELIEAIHARGMYVLFDLVMNHTSDQHPWFVESSSDRSNARRDWYIWADGKGRKPPNNWKNMLGRCGWHYSAARDQWYFASFLPFQPDLNYRNPAVKEAMLDVVRHWLDRGVDGFRLDIFNVIYKDAELRHNPHGWNPLPTEKNPAGGFQRNTRTANLPETMALACELRAVIDEYADPPRVLLGEVFGDHAVIKHFLGDKKTSEGGEGLNLIFLFDLLHYRFSAEYFRQKLALFEGVYAAPRTPTYVFSNHDNRRSIGRIDGDMRKAKLLALLQLTARGVAVTYQGEEIGMTDTPIAKEDAQDPVSHLYDRVPQWLRLRLPQLLNRDECRTPMQWSGKANGGFCADGVNPWLPLNPNVQHVNVAAQESDPDSLLNTYRTLLRMRREHDALRWGSMSLLGGERPVRPTAENVLVYRRGEGQNALTVLLNFGDHAERIRGVDGGVLFSTDPDNRASSETLLQPYSGLIVR